MHFRRVRNIWLTLALVAAAVHQVEHIFLFSMYLFNKAVYVNGGPVLSPSLFICTIPDGSGVQAGLLGHNGVLATLLGRDSVVNALLPNRINLHFVYNTVVLVPMLLGFVRQTRFVYDEWLTKALPGLSEEQLIAVTARLTTVTFPANAIIFRQGEMADRLYIISRGQVDVLRREGHGVESPVARLAEGQFFGEIGVLGRTKRTATVRAVTDVECLALDREFVKALLATSVEAHKDVDMILRRRLIQLGAVHGLAIKEAVNADPDTVLKTQMIRTRLQLIDGDEVSQLLGMLLAEPVGPKDARRVPARQSPAVAMGATTAGINLGTLTVRSGASNEQRFPVNAPRIVVGRRDQSKTDLRVIAIDDNRVSRQHIEISARADALYVRDLGSRNGTWINGRKLGGDWVRLEDNAEIRLGPETVLHFQATMPASEYHASIAPTVEMARI